MSGETRSVVVRLSMTAADFIREAQTAGKVGEDAMQRVRRSAMSADEALDKTGQTAGRIAAVGFAALFATGKAAMDWESQWAGVTKTVDGTTEQMAELEQGLRSLATSLPATHEEIAGVAEAAGQLGVAREDIVDFTKTMVDLGETTNLTAEDAATNIAQIANVMGTAGDEVDNLGAALVALGNDGASTEAQILGMAQRIAGAGAQIGLAESDILAIANAAASMGIEVEAGGSAVSRVFTSMAKATAQGGAELDTFAQVAGMSARDFAEAFENDPARAFASFTEGLDRINQSGGDVFTTLDELKLSDVRVSQALLGMAASGDLLRESLDLGAEAWRENTALSDEAAKRYETSAAQVQIAWNQIKDAAIDAGAVILPVVVDLAEAVGTVADAFGALPAPVQSSAMIAVAALTGGAGLLWATTKVIGGVNTAKATFEALDVSAGKAAGSTGKMAAALGLVGAAVAGAMIIDEFITAVDRAPIGVEATTAALLGLKDAAKGGATSEDLELLADSVERILNPEWNEKTDDWLRGKLPLFGDAADRKEAVADLESLDQALAGLVASAGPEVAADMFSDLYESGTLTAEQFQQLSEMLPQYQEALTGAANESQLAADAQDDLGSGARAAGDAMQMSAEEVEAAAKAYQDARDAAFDTADSFFSVAEAVQAADGSLEGFIASLEQQANALINVKNNAIEAAENGVRKGLINSLEEAGPAGAVILEKLANATESQIGRANAAFKRGEQAKRDYANFKVPPVRLDVDESPAVTAIERIRAALANIKDKSVTVRVTQTGAAVTPGFGPQVDGSVLDFYANGGLRENHVAQIAPAGMWRVWAEPETGGEAYIPLAESKRERSIDIWEEVGSRLGVQFARFADGGTRGGRRGVGVGVVPGNTGRLETAIERLTLVAADQTAALDDANRTLDGWSAKMADVAQATVAGFNTGLFDRDANIWSAGAGGGPLANLARDIAGLQERGALQSQLSGMGLSGDALAALLAQGSNADIAGMIQRGEIGQYAAMFGTRAGLQSSVGGEGGRASYGAAYDAAAEQVKAQTATVEKTNVELAGLRSDLALMERRISALTRDNAETTGHVVGQWITKGAVAGHKEKKNRGRG